MHRLQFDFSLDTMIEALAYLASKGLPDLTKLKAVKLLYFADRYHLLKYGRPIIGDSYSCMPFGPVPSESLNIINGVLAGADEVSDPVRERFTARLEFRKRPFQKHPRLTAKVSPNLDRLSMSEIEALDATVAEYGRKSANELVTLSHGHAAWRIADEQRAEGSSVPMPYELFFEDAGDDEKKVLAVAEAEQEDRDFANGLRAAGREAQRRRGLMPTHAER